MVVAVGRPRWLLGVALLGACHEPSVEIDEEPPPPRWDTVCGSAQPHLLLPLQAGEHATRLDTLPDSDRVLVSTFWTDPQIVLSDYPPTLDRTIYSVGPCGEAPEVVASGLSLTSRVGDTIVACDDGGHGAWWLDPTGVQSPRRLFDAWCPLRATDQGALAVEAAPQERFGTAVLLRSVDDPSASTEVLATSVRTSRNTFFGAGSNWTTSVWAKDDRALLLDAQGVLLTVDLASGEAQAELAGVQEFRASGDGRWLLWQADEPAEGDPDTPVSPVFLRDREQPGDVHLLNTHLEWTGNPFVGPYLMVRDDFDGLRVFWQSDGAPITLPEGTEVRGLLEDDDLWLARRSEGGTQELRWSPAEGGAPEVIVDHSGTVTRYGEGIEIFDEAAAPFAGEGSLHFVPFTGGTPTLVADRVHQSRRRLRDGRILTLVDEDATGHGSLRLLDPDADRWDLIDGRGFVQSPRLNASDAFAGDVVFASADRAPAGRAVFRARLAAP